MLALVILESITKIEIFIFEFQPVTCMYDNTLLF